MLFKEFFSIFSSDGHSCLADNCAILADGILGNICVKLF